MRPILVSSLALAALVSAALPARAADTVPASEASEQVGRTVTVCGTVASASHFDRLKGEPTFLNFDRPYPDQDFTVVIWGETNSKFDRPPHELFRNKDLCVTGRVEMYKGKPQITVRDPGQIAVTSESFDAGALRYEDRVLMKAMLAGLGYPVDEGTGAWSRADDDALGAYRAASGAGEGDTGLFRALAASVDSLDAEARGRVLKLVLLNLAQRGGPEGSR